MQTLKLDVYQPHGDTVTKRPAIVWVHGGGFKTGTKTSGEIVDQANEFAKRGYLNVSIDYRLTAGLRPVHRPVHRRHQDGVPRRPGRGAVAAGQRRHLRHRRRPHRRRRLLGRRHHRLQRGLRLRDRSATAATPATPRRSGPPCRSPARRSPPRPAKGDPPTFDMHGDADTIVPLAWNDTTLAAAAKVRASIAERTVWKGDGHVPYGEHRTEIIDQTRNFLYAAMDLSHAAR